MARPPHLLPPFLDPGAPFPDPRSALPDPEGLLAVGADLSVDTLLRAYRHGIFPWFSPGEPILWWSPPTRAAFLPSEIHCSRSLRTFMRRCAWTLTLNTAFDDVLRLCAETPRHGQRGTWITAEMREAYSALHRAGHAHAIEVWQAGRLIGGLYGPAIGGCFFGESMFSLETSASRVALVALAAWLAKRGFALLDAQFPTPHLLSMGVKVFTREAYLQRVANGCEHATTADWRPQTLSETDWRP